MTRILAIVLATLLFGAIGGYFLVLGRTSVEDISQGIDTTQRSDPGTRTAREPREAVPQDEQGHGTSTGAEAADLRGQLREFESIMGRFLRRDPIAELQSSVDELVEKHNQQVTQKKAEFETQRRQHEKQVQAVRALERDIQRFDERLAHSKPNAADRDGVAAYNDLVSQRNALVTKHRKLAAACQKNQAALNDAIDRVNQETAKREKQIESAKRGMETQVEVYRQWRQSKQDDEFWRELNRFYAHLFQQAHHRESEVSDTQNAELTECIAKARALRQEIGERFAEQQADRQEGLIAVRATLCGVEDCFYIVDTGATLLTISPSLVDRLDLSDRMGDEIEVSLAGNIRIKAPQITIPQISVLGMAAQDIKGIVLDEPDVGADGLLGMSFLSRFDYRIDEHDPNKLILKPRPEDRHEPRANK